MTTQLRTQQLSVPADLQRKLTVTLVISALVLLVSLIIWPDRAWANLLLVAWFVLTLGLGAGAFLAMTNVCGAGWNVAFRRVPEAMCSLIPIGGILAIVSLMLKLPQYTWHHHGEHGAGTFWFKELWLNANFLVVRAVIYLVLWTLLSRMLVNRSRQQDNLPESTDRINTFVSVLYLFVFAITISLAGVDWIMALEPMWFSTMWGVYQFSGLFMGTLAVMIITCLALRREGVLGAAFRKTHLHDLGKLLLGFSCFWMYIWFSQYMLIWYANIPEETSYFLSRTHGPWGPVVIFSLILNWGLPFFVLLPKPSKRSLSIMLRISVVVLIGRWVDLYVMIFPALELKHPPFGIPEVAGIFLLSSLTALFIMRAFSATSAVPMRDPYLSESLHYHA